MISDVKHLFKDRLLSEKQRNIEYKLWGHFYKNIYIYLCQKPKNVQTTIQLRSFHMLASYAQNPSSWASAVHEPRISRCTTRVLKRQRNQNIHCIMKKGREFQKNIYFCFTDCVKSLTGWITTNCGKLLKRWEYQNTLLASWETCMQVKKQQLQMDMNNGLGQNLERSVPRLCIVTLLFKLSVEYIM